MTRRFRYVQAGTFTDRRFSGNQLAVSRRVLVPFRPRRLPRADDDGDEVDQGRRLMSVGKLDKVLGRLRHRPCRAGSGG